MKNSPLSLSIAYEVSIEPSTYNSEKLQQQLKGWFHRKFRTLGKEKKLPIHHHAFLIILVHEQI